MTLNDYQQRAMSTCLPASNNFAYMMMNLMGEVGEFTSKVAKAIRKNGAHITDNRLYIQKAEAESCQMFDELRKEAGDILWQLSGQCTVLGWSLEDIAQQNIDKLADRKQRHVIDGNGDNR